MLSIALVGAMAVAVPAQAAPPQGALSITKLVNGQDAVTLAPGDEFDYVITVGCDDNDCINATMTDALPAAFDGFQILGTTVTPTSQPSTVAYTGCSGTVTANCGLSVTFLEGLLGGGVGIIAGHTYQVSVAMKAPQNLPATWPSNGVAVTNTASAQADTAATVTDSADVTVNIPVTVDTVLGKTWLPATQQYLPGAASTITLSSQNTSNVPASTLTVQDPVSAVDGATALGADNPFRLVDFAGFGAVALPAGADTVQVDAYVFDTVSGTYLWQPGSPRAPADIQLPTGVTNADVVGLRFTYAGAGADAAITPAGAAGSVALGATLRTTNRQTGASLVGGGTVTNQAQGTVTVPGQDPVSKTASAPYTVGPLTVAVSADKQISPARIPAGTTAKATITAKNDSNGPLSSLKLDDLDFFTDAVVFDGFSAPISYPTGATAATITWYYSDGSTQSSAVPNSSTPAAPAAPGGQHLTGFSIEYTGAVAAGAQTTSQFGIKAGVGLVPDPATTVDLTNTLGVTGTNAKGSATASDTAPLAVFYPDIKLGIDKKISPSGAVSPGATVVAQLPTTTSTDSAYVNPTSIVVEDSLRPGVANDFWNAFQPIAIAPTQVLAGSTLTIEYTTDGGATWVTFTTVDATGGTQVYSGNLPSADVPNITGLRYTFADADGFPQGTTVSPNAVFQALPTLRGTSTPTSVPNAAPTVYENLGQAQAQGSVDGKPVVQSDVVTDVANAKIQTESGVGTLIASKAWRTPDFSGDLSLLSSQSGASAATLLGWGVTSTGYSSATISDPSGTEATPAQSVFQAFDLTSIAPVGYGTDPLLKWDTVSQVQLYIGGNWVTVTPPSGGWMGSNGFRGYTLTGSESQNATGVRFVVTPNDAARASSSDPLAPPVGSGVATSANGSARSLGLVWKLRNALRVPSANPSYPWVTATQGFNDPTPGTVINTVGVSGVQNGTPVGPRTAQDNIALIDQPPAVDVTKSSQKAEIVVPNPGDVPAAGYPTNDFTITAKNNSSSRASYLRVTDPMPCTDGTVASCVSAPDAWAANPYAGAVYTPGTNPFERFDLTGLAFSYDATQIDPLASTVFLWERAADGTLSTRTTTLATAPTLTDLGNVVGVSVVYQGTNPAANGGSIATGSTAVLTLHTKLRITLRSDTAVDVTPFQVENYAFAQSYDPVLYPSGPQSTPSDSANAAVTIIGGKLGVTAQKVFSPDSLLERDRTTPVTATLTATQGDATVPTNQVTVSDTDAEFWNEFRLTGLTGADVTLPAGSDRVQVDVQLNGSASWTTGAPAATAALPALPSGKTEADITGIRFVFTRADGGLFSHTMLPENWTATALLHVTLLDVARSGDPILFPSSVDNVVTSNSHRTDDPAVYADANADAQDTVTLEPGSYALDVSKTPQGNIHSVTPGDPNEWTMTFANTGTGYLTIAELVDQLPTTLEWDGATPAYATSAGGLLSTDVTVAYDAATRAMTFTWPTGGQRMAPGETFTVTLGIVLQPGLGAGLRATNQMVVTTGQTLSACTNTSGNGQGTLAGVGPAQCGTTNYVQPIPGASLMTTKSVKGAVAGGQNLSTPGAPCLSELGGYYRYPCAANTVVGGVDEWKLAAVNSGTVAYTQLTLVDPLPFPGDRLLATGGSRGSTFRPQLDNSYQPAFTAPAGTTVTWQVTTAADVCVGSGATAWPSDPTCSTHPVASDWSDGATYTGDFAAVTGIRYVFDFTTTAAHLLAPGGGVQVLYHTVNHPATTANPEQAPVSVPVTDAVAWNQFGASAVLSVGGVLSRAPIKAGVVLTGGPLQITKAVTGAGAATAPTSFGATASCTVDGQPVDFQGAGHVTLDAANSYTARIDGIPLGAACTVTEDGTEGSYGETTRTVSPTSVTIASPASNTAPVPADQQVTVTNDYALTSLTVTKTVSTLATVGDFGPFTYTATCTTALGAPIALAPEDATFTLSDGGSHTIGALPVRADCTVTESDTDHATDAGNSVTVSVNGGPATSGTAADVTLADGANTAAYTNTYGAGTLAVTKTLAGGAAGDGSGTPGPDDGYGQGPFTVAITCTYDGQTLYDDSIQLVGGQTTTLPEQFPVGTSCAVSETVTAGANSSVVDLPTVLIPAAVSPATVGAVTVDVTNTFNPGSVHITKVRNGAGADVYGAGPFTAQVTCTWQKDGQTLTIPLPNGGIVVLDSSNSYEATVDGLIQGADCAVVETEQGGATSVTYSPAGPADGALASVPEGAPAEVTITNTFDTGSLAVVKKRVGSGVDAFGAGPFTVQVVCTWLKDAVVTPIDLGDASTLVLSADNGYKANVEGLIAGADCAVTETDRGLATASVTDPADGHITILADGVPAGPATVTVTNTFDVGQLSLEKTVDKKAVSVGDTVVYTITLKNVGEIDATGITVTDEFPKQLTIVSTSPAATSTTGNTLSWQVASLPVGATQKFTVTAVVNSSGTIANLANVTNPVGPWGEVDHAGDVAPDGESQAQLVATVPVLPGDGGLASTGLAAATGLVLGTGVIALGLALFVFVRRRRRA